MKLTVISIGHGYRKEELAWISTYQKRLKTMITFEHVHAKDKYDLYQNRDHPKYIAWIESLLPPKSLVYWLDEHGQTKTTTALSDMMEQGYSQHDHLAFVVGGAYGLPKAMLTQKKQTIALSSLTLPHKMAVLLLHEQLYRSFCIQKNLPYHHV